MGQDLFSIPWASSITNTFHHNYNEHYHNNQSPILKFSPSNCLHFLSQYTSVSRNQQFLSYKAIYTPILQIHHVSHIGFLPIKTCKIKILFFWHFGHKLQPKSEWKKNKHDWNQTNRILSKSCSHILPLDACRWFLPPYITMYGSNHLKSTSIILILDTKEATSLSM